MQHDPNSTLIGIIVLVVFVLGMRALSRRLFRDDTSVPSRDGKQLPVLVRTYAGTPESSARAFHQQAGEMAAQGYFPVSQSYTPGAYTGGQFLLALLLCFVLIGIVIFIYMLLVKPPGTLQVTYELRQRHETREGGRGVVTGTTKNCPRCAETVKEAAVVCRYCGHEFGPTMAAGVTPAPPQ